MRIRTVKPEFWSSEDVWALSSDSVRLLFVGLWNYVDDQGYGPANPLLVAAALYPLSAEHDAVLVAGGLDELERVGMVCRFEAGGKLLLHLPSWGAHQKISHPGRPRFAPCVRCSGGLPESSGGLRPQVNCGGEGSSPSREVEVEVEWEKEKGSGSPAGDLLAGVRAEARRLRGAV